MGKFNYERRNHQTFFLSSSIKSACLVWPDWPDDVTRFFSYRFTLFWVWKKWSLFIGYKITEEITQYFLFRVYEIWHTGTPLPKKGERKEKKRGKRKRHKEVKNFSRHNLFVFICLHWHMRGDSRTNKWRGKWQNDVVFRIDMLNNYTQ